MPELPEVETSCLGIEPFIKNNKVKKIIIRQPKLRWLIPATIKAMENQTIQQVKRRGKYILMTTKSGTALLHLGMSGSLHIIPADKPLKKHDHVDILFYNDICLRFNDPRRFGALLWTDGNPYDHALLQKLGLEPLTDDFSGNYLWQRSRQSKRAIKLFIMASHVVVGIGNIYANEALFHAGINPKKAAGKISKMAYDQLVYAIKAVLTSAIEAGGTTLRDFQSAHGKPGYFQQDLKVYGKKGQACVKCQHTIKLIRLGQRSTFYCSYCQN